MMGLIGDAERQAIEKELEAKLVDPVRLAVFSQTLALPGQEELAAASEQTRRLVEELAALHPKLSAESCSFVGDRERVDALGIERIPAIAVLREDGDPGIRLYGRIEGYEFGTLLDAVVDVSAGVGALEEATREALGALEQKVHIQVFSTPT